MCLVFPKFVSPQIATEDIKVYKFLQPVDVFYSYYVAPVYSYGYGSLQDILNTTFRQELAPLRVGIFSLTNSQIYSEYGTSQGLYSFKEIRNIPVAIWFECVIPKGATYYTNGEEYCSNELKFVKKLAK